MVGKRDENSELRQRELFLVRLRQVVGREWWTQRAGRRWPWNEAGLAGGHVEQAS